jgi:hypothetical protein
MREVAALFPDDPRGSFTTLVADPVPPRKDMRDVASTPTAMAPAPATPSVRRCEEALGPGLGPAGFDGCSRVGLWMGGS